MLSEAYGRAYCSLRDPGRALRAGRAVPGTIPIIEQPQVFADRVLAFAGVR